MDLRERRRMDTVRLIQRAALGLAAQQDPETITVEAICAEAGVSRRTFFNYFPVKEAAFVVGPPPLRQDVIDRFLNGTGALAEDLIDLITSQLPSSDADRRAMRQVHELLSRQVRITAMQISAFHTQEQKLAELLARRLGRSEADLECRTIAAATIAATRVAVTDWAAAGEGENGPDLRSSFDYLQRLVAR